MPQPSPTAASTPPPPVSHLAYLDGLRAAAALFVVFHHAWLEAGMPSEQFGHDAVGLFIVISGFCLALPVIRDGGQLRAGALGFFKRRAWRILPPYYITLAVSILLIWLFLGNQPAGHFDETYVVTPKGVITHLLLVQQAFRSTSMQIIGPGWSIGVEWWIYFLFPTLVVLFRRLGALPTTALATLASAALSFAALNSPLNMDSHGVSPQYIALFAFGMLSAEIARSDKPLFVMLRQRVPWATLTALLLPVIILLARPWSEYPVAVYKSDYVVGLWSAALLIAASRPGSRLNQTFSWAPLAFIGTFAYSIYLMHSPLLRLAWQYGLYPLGLSPLGNLSLLWLVIVPLVVAVCYLFFLVAERPFLNRRPGRAPRAAPQPAVTSAN